MSFDQQYHARKRRPRIFTWHVHGSYLYYLSLIDAEFYLPVRPDRGHGYGGKINADPLGSNVHEVPVDEVKSTEFDIILFQARQHYEVDQYELFSESQRRLPKLYLEHDPPRQHPTDTVHWATNDPSVTIVHVTNFNRLMWDNKDNPTAVIDHGVVAPKVDYKGHLERGIVIINNLRSRGRRLGADIYEYCRKQVPLDVIGINATEMPGGVGEVPHNELFDFISQYRFYFNPIRYTSLGLSIIESMMVGMPIVGLQTTELVSVIENGVNGYLSLDPDELVIHMKKLLASHEHARTLGYNARLTALQRFSIPRFSADWEALFQSVNGGRESARLASSDLTPVSSGGTA